MWYNVKYTNKSQKHHKEVFYMFSLTNDYKQMSFDNQISKIGALPNSDPVKFIELLKTYFDISTFIPQSFYDAYYSSSTNSREYSLESMLSILLLSHFFKFASIPNFLLVLIFSVEIREFCRLPDNKVPTESVISKFKTSFDKELLKLFNNVSQHVMDVFTEFNDSLPNNSPLKGLSEELIYDTTGLKPKVKENNPKTIATEVKNQTNYKHFLEQKDAPNAKSFNAYLAAYKSLPKSASSNSAIRLDYANGHFGYFYKYGMLTNGFGIPLHIHFLDEEFYNSLPNEFDTMEEQKYVYDNASLHPVLSSFLERSGSNVFTTFLGDSEFDSYDNYNFLNECGFSKVLIPINSRNSKSVSNVSFPRNEEGVPCCPNDSSLSFKADGTCKGKNRSFRLKYVCPKSIRVKGKWTCQCENKCRDTNSTITTYIYPNENLRLFFGVQRGSEQWNDVYKHRTIIERSFSSLKSHPSIAMPKTLNCASMRSDVFLNATTKLITVILAFSLQHSEYMSNLKKLLKVA